jgi:hypothetical protein
LLQFLKGKGKDMSQSKLTRRGFAAAFVTGAAAIGLLGVSARTADAYQGDMERTLSALSLALSSLSESTSDAGGHRAKAVQLIQQAINETQAGIDFADQHTGDGS